MKTLPETKIVPKSNMGEVVTLFKNIEGCVKFLQEYTASTEMREATITTLECKAEQFLEAVQRLS